MATSALDTLRSLFAQYHLDALVDTVDDIVKQGMPQSQALLTLYDSQAYKDRFAGNDGRTSKLSPGDYLRLEQSYKDEMASFGLPTDFYDQPSDFANLIKNDISPDEVRYRAQKAWDFTANADQATKDALGEYYGLRNEADIVAYFLDADKGAALIQKRERAATLGAAARRNGITVDRSLAEQLQSLGVDPGSAANKFGDLGAVKPELDAANSRFGGDYGTADQVLDVTTGLASAQRKRRSLTQQEQGLFAERSTVKSNASANDQTGNSMDRHGDF